MCLLISKIFPPFALIRHCSAVRDTRVVIISLVIFPRLPFTTLLSAKDELASERLLKYLVNFISNGDPNQGYSVENNANWEPATQPN